MIATVRIFLRNAVLIAVASIVAGCGFFLPGFEGPFGVHSWLHKVPMKSAAQQVQCELADVLRNPKYKGLLDRNSTAGLQVRLTTDVSGNVTYVGVDLSKVGLTPLAQLVSVQNKVPSLAAGATLKSTVSSQIEFSVAQAIGDAPIREDNKSIQPIPSNFVDCKHAPNGLAVPLDLDLWLERFLGEFQEDASSNMGSACMTKITLNTQFQFVFDIKSGLNPIGGVFILPVSGLNGDFSPALTHSLQISLVPNPKNPLICRQPPSQKPPSAPATMIVHS